ncbi:MAG: carbon starvation protein A [Synergistaceae bacterium]|jgi:carbon starvation protein CstA|nr:carbon starvation protein A [Synergistaceae bacterium]
MTTFIIGLVILAVGSVVYGKVCENVMKPDDRKTPAFTKTDGVDYVPMKTWKNSLINLLNIAGTGPILGPIQGILFGPVAFILIPIGNILGGSMHDYFSGMLSLRNNGMQMPDLVKKYTNTAVFNLYNVFICLLMLLVGAVFIYTPGDIAATQLLGFSGAANAPSTWVIYAVIFAYYIAATMFPIDKIIGRVYPIFGAILIFSAVGVFICLFAKGYTLTELSWENWRGIHPGGQSLIPMFFITVACGIVSGFHSTQTAIIARSVTSEKQGRLTFYNMMILEGFIAMIWAAAAMAVFNKGIAIPAGEGATSPNAVVGIVARDMLGNVGGLIAILGVIVLPVTSGDTALRSLRLMVGDFLKIDQRPLKNRLSISSIIFVLVAAILIWAKMSPGGFNVLWRYFAWSNQTIAVFAFAIITIYLLGKGHRIAPLMSLIPGAWYCFITFSYICNARIGLNLPMNVAYILGVILAIVYSFLIYKKGLKLYETKAPLEAVPVA